MGPFFLECTIRAALIVIGTAVVLYAMRVKVASVKHRVWTAVLLLMLVLPAWTAWGPKAELRLLPTSTERFASQPLAPVSISAPTATQPAAQPTQPVTARRHLLSSGEDILLGIYLLGVLTLLFRLAVGTIKAQRLIRTASALSNCFLPRRQEPADPSPRLKAPGLRDDTNGRRDVCCSRAWAAPVTVGCLRPTVILPQHWREWSAPQLAAVLAHEGEHVRRRDPLVQWLALLNRAIFWFHPAAWWLERELSGLAEECCDAAVIAQGHDPRDYAETLMKIARDVMGSGSRINSVAVAMPGPRLPQRIRAIIDERAQAARISRARGTSVVAACLTTCAALGAVTLSRAQAPQATGGKASFEVASVNQDKDGRPYSNFPLGPGNSYSANGGLLSAVDMPVSTYIGFAYGLTTYQRYALDAQLPKWAKEERFDIQARAAANATKDQMRMMMRSLLADRFRLVAHSEEHEGPVFALVLAKPGEVGPQLHLRSSDSPACGAFTLSASARLADGSPTACDVFLSLVDAGHIKTSARNVTLQAIAQALPFPGMPQMDRPVVDESSLSGNYDFSIDYAAETTTAPDTKSGEPTFLEALQDQLGLKLISAAARIDTLVIDHIEEPTPN